MDLRIKHIILWPKDILKEKRVIKFELDKVNVISGISHTGKSSLTHILDYCLGSEKCTIPTGEIRKTTDWFGVHFVSGNIELIIARKNPGGFMGTDEMYISEGFTLDINSINNIVEGNTNRKYVIQRLNELSGFSTEKIESDNYVKGAASFRDTTAFQFQPQHIIANPFTLFYKADTAEHQQKLRTIFPLLIGAVTNEILLLEKEIKGVETDLRIKLQAMNAKKQAKDAWLNNITVLYNKSIELGLLKDVTTIDSTWAVETYLFYLYKVLEDFKTNSVSLFQVGNTEKSVKAMNAFLQQEKELSGEIALRRMKLSKIERLNNAGEEYKTNIRVHKNRLQPVGWFQTKVDNDNCPFCDSENHKAKEQINSLVRMAKKYESISQSVGDNINLDKEINDIKKGIRELEAKVYSVREIIRDLYLKSAEADKTRLSIEEIFKFIGRLEQALENVKSTDSDSGLGRQIAELIESLEILKKKLEEKKAKTKLSNIQKKISALIHHYVELLDIDHPKDLVKLDIYNLTVKIVSEDNVENYLWEIGSGANWMGYHIATLLALHEYFLELKINYVPSFILIDQPSQVYFPDKVIDEGKEAEINQVRKIFKAVSDAINRTEKKFQIIIVEHAPELTWNGVEDIKLVEEWRNGKALIPSDWYS